MRKRTTHEEQPFPGVKPYGEVAALGSGSEPRFLVILFTVVVFGVHWSIGFVVFSASTAGLPIRSATLMRLASSWGRRHFYG